MTRLVLISDTHNQHDQLTLPPGDLLIHAGDFSGTGTFKQMSAFFSWFAAQPHPHKVLVAGNHDITLHREFYQVLWWRFHRERADDEAIRAHLDSYISRGAFHYLQDQEVEVAGLRIYGSPWQPEFCSWAFNLPRGEPCAQKWAEIPVGVDVLITHGPPWGTLDQLDSGEHVGCEALQHEIFTRVRPKLHVFGHIHEGYGLAEVEGVILANASSCDGAYAPVQPPLVLDFER